MSISTTYHNSDTVAEQLVLANLPFATHMAKKWFSRFPGEHDDLISEAKLGLLRAAQSYDFRPGVKFITYAAWWINQHIKKFEMRHSGAMSIPDKQWLKGVRAPSVVSLDMPIHSDKDNDFTVGNTVALDELGYDHIEQRELLRQIVAAAQLTPKESLIIRGRFFDSLTLIEISRTLHRSRARVNQIEEVAMWKLRRAAGILPVDEINPTLKRCDTNSSRQRQKRYWQKANARRRRVVREAASEAAEASISAPLEARAV
jgi:RNA polymerase sigma factor (sigma-70 family)